MSNKIFPLVLLSLISTSVLADNYGERTRLRSRYQSMDVCSEIKKKINEMERQYSNFSNVKRNIDRQITTMNQNLSSRKSNLESVKNDHAVKSQILAEFTNLNQNKVRIRNEQNLKIKNAEAKIPAAQSDYEAKKKKVDGYSSWVRVRDWRKYGKDKDARDDAKKYLNSLQEQKRVGIETIQKINNIKKLLREASSNAKQSQAVLTREMNRQPSISDLSTDVRVKNSERQKLIEEYSVLEDQLAQSDVKLEKCEKMKFDSAVYRSLIKHAKVFRNEGCEEHRRSDMLRYSKFDYEKQGIAQAYELVCEADLVEYETTNRGASSEFVSLNFSTGKYGSRLTNKEVLVINEVRARAISVVLENVDIEHYYDKLTVLDDKNQIVAEIENPGRHEARGEVALENIETTKLIFVISSDSATEGAGFSVSGYTAHY